MNRKDIFHTIGMINDDLIVQAGNATGRVRHAGLSKVAAIAVAAMMLLGATAFAAVILLSGRGGHSYNIPTYYTVPSQQILTEDVGFGIKIMDRFTNGYCFKAGYIAENEERVELNSKLIEQIKKHRAEMENWKEELESLLPRAGESATVDERILVLDSKIERSIDGRAAISVPIKQGFVAEKINELISKIDQIIESE